MEFQTILCINHFFLLFPKLTPEGFFSFLYTQSTNLLPCVWGVGLGLIQWLCPLWLSAEAKSNLFSRMEAPSQASLHFSSVAQSCPTLCNPMNHSTPGLPVHHQLLESTQTHVHWLGDVIQPSHPLSSPSPPALNLSQHQGLFKWVSSLHQVAKVLEFQLQPQSFQWTPRTDLL